MSRTRVRRRRLSLMLTCGLVAAAWVGPVGHALAGADAAAVASHRYVVRSGDTLWSIASRVARGEDPRPIVDAIAQANNVDAGGLVPGRTLVIPTSA